MSRYVIDTSVVLHLLKHDLAIRPDCQLVAPASVRSAVLAALYQEVLRGETRREEALELHAAFSSMKIRLLGDKVLRRRAWDIAERLGWDTTERAEYIALTQLQADAFVTLDSDLAHEVRSGARRRGR